MRFVLCGLLLLSTLLQPAQGAEPLAAPGAASAAAGPSELRPEAWVDAFLERNLLPHLRVSAAHAPVVRTAALAMVGEHLPRLRGLLLGWWQAELLRDEPKLAADRAMARAYNELALWSLDSLGAEHDRLMLQALQHETACHPLDEPVTELDQRLTRLRHLPPEALQQALAFEAKLLARWGQPRAALSAAQPFDVAALVQRWRQQERAGLAPLPRTLAAYAGDAGRGTPPRDVTRARALDRCLLQHWALRSALPQASDEAARAALLARWREGVAVQLPELLWMSREAAGTPLSSDDGYPELPKRFGVAGTLTLTVEIDAGGKVLNARVSERKLQVPGLPEGLRPAAFEALLDEASLIRARAMSFKPPASSQLVQGVLVASQPFVWSLK